eukprot:TRINITY_DN49989_c0_g1_i1.p1 TRINITY_DN49989_c0_g1~~TRINITY_DN49989_c0_g1_i1.p1  ORF type:complete len:256 (+),score=34.19 TRINITY_DN49989_c0_g1_i1:79-846(+)
MSSLRDIQPMALSAVGTFVAVSFVYWMKTKDKRERLKEESKDGALIPCLRARRSVFPRDYVDRKIEAHVVESLLEAAMWAPFHGPLPPWRFVVLGKNAMVEMQEVTLAFYDANWRRTGWPASGTDETSWSKTDYEKWRAMTQDEIQGRWGPVSYMISIVMQRQAHATKRMPEWEEAAATACAVENMYIQATAFPGLACYWSSWHGAARDSSDMKTFLKMNEEDKCLGFFIVAASEDDLPDRRVRKMKRQAIEWRA